jgi:DTW domain-containing protein YfiP
MHIILLTHERELHKKTNTGRLVEMLDGLNVTRVLWQRTSPDPMLLEWIEQGKIGLLYPETELGCNDANMNNMESTNEFSESGLALGQDNKAILSRFIIIDSTWQEARKIFNRSPYLKRLPRVSLVLSAGSVFTLRRNQIDGGLCTAESVIALLRMNNYNLLANKLETDFYSFMGRDI